MAAPIIRNKSGWLWQPLIAEKEGMVMATPINGKKRGWLWQPLLTEIKGDGYGNP